MFILRGIWGSALTALRRGHYKYIEAPRPEFYDLVQDPGESKNLYADRGSLALAYRERLNQLRQLYKARSGGTANALSPDVIERLHALGYLTGNSSTPTSARSAVDPKDRIADYEEYGRAIYLASAWTPCGSKTRCWKRFWAEIMTYLMFDWPWV